MTTSELAVAARTAGCARPWVSAAQRLDDRIPRAALLLVAAGVVATVITDRGLQPIDTELFTEAGRRLWSSDGLSVFDDPIIQAGVGELTFYAVLDSLERALRLPQYLLASIVCTAGVTAGTVWLAGRVALWFGAKPRASVLVLVGAVAVLLGFGSALYLAGHPAQFVIVCTWALAVRAMQRGRPVLAGVLLAVGTSFETWGMLGAPVLLTGRDWPARLKAGVTLTVDAAAAYLPFVVAGTFRMHEYRWVVRPTSNLAPLLGVYSTFGWPHRLGQALLTVVVASVVAWRLRDSAHAVWAVPLTVVATRLLGDPLGASYYWIPAQIMVLVGLAACVASRQRSSWVILALLYPVFLVGLVPQWVACLAVIAAVGVLVGASAGPYRERAAHR